MPDRKVIIRETDRAFIVTMKGYERPCSYTFFSTSELLEFVAGSLTQIEQTQEISEPVEPIAPALYSCPNCHIEIKPGSILATTPGSGSVFCPGCQDEIRTVDLVHHYNQ